MCALRKRMFLLTYQFQVNSNLTLRQVFNFLFRFKPRRTVHGIKFNYFVSFKKNMPIILLASKKSVFEFGRLTEMNFVNINVLKCSAFVFCLLVRLRMNKSHAGGVCTKCLNLFVRQIICSLIESHPNLFSDRSLSLPL